MYPAEPLGAVSFAFGRHSELSSVPTMELFPLTAPRGYREISGPFRGSMTEMAMESALGFEIETLEVREAAAGC